MSIHASSTESLHRDELTRAKAFLQRVGNPQEKVKTIHIAGTSGKGSVAYMLTDLLKSQGLCIGTYTSPHVYDLRERFMVDREFISSDEFIAKAKHIYAQSEAMRQDTGANPSYFEALNAMAFEVFADNEVDYAVVETGLGGLYDATNTIERRDKLAVLTRIGLDHTKILGETLPEIAFQKAGIIPIDGEVLALRQTEEITNVFKEVAAERRADLKWIDISPAKMSATGYQISWLGKSYQTNLIMPFQVENLFVALEAFEHIMRRDNVETDFTAVANALQSISIPGRFEVRNYRGREIVLDAAHNPQKMQAFLTGTKNRYDNPLFLVAFKEDKDVASMLQLLSDAADRFIVTEYTAQDDSRLYSAHDAVDLERQLLALNPEAQVRSIKNLKEAIKYALNNSEGTVVITGSIYLVGEAGNILSTIS